jgi:hypothetical protein
MLKKVLLHPVKYLIRVLTNGNHKEKEELVFLIN